MDRAQAKRLVSMVAANYPSPAWPRERLRLFESIILDLDGEAGERAVLDWLRLESRCPTPADIRKLVARQSAGDSYLGADEAWEYVERQIRTVGSYGRCPDRYPLVERTIGAMGGWQDLCLSTNIVADRAHFRQIYESLLDRARRDAITTPGAQIRGIASPPERQQLEHDRRQVREELPDPAMRGVLRNVIADLEERGAKSLRADEPHAEHRELTSDEIAERKRILRDQAALYSRGES